MTTAIETVRSALLAHSPLTAQVGQRIRADLAAEADALPLIVLRQIGYIPHGGLDDSVHAGQYTVQVEAWGDTRSASAALQQLAEAALRAAGLPPDDADPDGLDPDTAARAAVLNVDVWLQ